MAVGLGSANISIGTVEVTNDAGNPLPISGTISAVQSGNWSNIPDRPSSKTGRTYKTGMVTAATTSTTIYTVTASKTLYVTSLILSGFNSSTSTAGILNIRDDTTTLIPISIPTAGVGALASLIPATPVPITFEEPLRFSTNVNIEENAGTLTFSCAFIGYEE